MLQFAYTLLDTFSIGLEGVSLGLLGIVMEIGYILAVKYFNLNIQLSAIN